MLVPIPFSIEGLCVQVELCYLFPDHTYNKGDLVLTVVEKFLLASKMKKRTLWHDSVERWEKRDYIR